MGPGFRRGDTRVGCAMRAVLIAAVMIATASAARAGEGEREVWVNGLRMSADQLLLLEEVFAVCVQDGAYRYDPESGDLRAIALSDLSARVRAPQYAHAGDRAEDKSAAYR